MIPRLLLIGLCFLTLGCGQTARVLVIQDSKPVKGVKVADLSSKTSEVKVTDETGAATIQLKTKGTGGMLYAEYNGLFYTGLVSTPFDYVELNLDQKVWNCYRDGAVTFHSKAGGDVKRGPAPWEKQGPAPR